MRSINNLNKRKQQKRKIWDIVISLTILLTLGLGVTAGYYGSKVMSFLDEIHAADGTEEDEKNSLEFTRKLDDLEPFSAMILGLDVEEGEDSRSDTIIVATVNPKTKDMKLVSIPRDTLITLPAGHQEKINAAYPTGGAILTRQMVSEFLEIPIHFYASLDFQGLVDLVDAVDGVTVNSRLDFSEGDAINGGRIEIEKGLQRLDGAEALAYARMRKQDPMGDFGRQQRQQEVIIQILEELASFKSVTNFTDILEAVSANLKTNATTNQILTIATNYSDVIRNVEQFTIEGDGSRTYFPHYGFDVYTWEPYAESLYEVRQELQHHLGQKSINDSDSIHAEPNEYESNQATNRD